MAASVFLKKRVEDEKKKTEQKPVASIFLQNLAKGSKETVLNSSGARVTYDNNPMGLYKAAQRVESNTPKKAGTSPASSSIGSTLNPRPTVTIPKPAMADFKALTAKKHPTVNINLDKKPLQSLVTVNPTLVTATGMPELQRSTAKDRKTMLYETNDSLLSNDEILEKYQYVLNDNDMDYETQKRAVKKGIPTVGKTLIESSDYAQYNKVAQLQASLQKKLKSTAFTAGFLDATGGNLKDIIIKHSNNEALQKQNEALKQSFQQMQQAHPGYYSGGNITGEFSKAAAGYMTAGAAAEAAFARGTEVLSSRMLSATAPDAAQKLAALIKYNPNITKAAAFGTRMLGQQAADTAVNTPITIMASMAAGKDKSQTASDVAKQQAMDLGFNLGLGALGIGGKVLNNVAKTKKTQKNIAVQIKNSMTGKMPSNEYIKLGETPEILKKYGMINGEMMMPQTVVPKVAYPAEYRQALAKGAGISDGSIKNIQGHNLGFEAIRQLPEKMKKPVAILKSETQDESIVVLTDMIDAYGQPVIVPIRVQKAGLTEFGTVIPSLYGRQGFGEFMERQKSKGNVLYLDKKRNLQKLPNNGLQLPESFTDADPMLILAREKGKVKDAALRNIAKGNKLIKIEDAKPTNVTSPPDTSKTAIQLSLNNSISGKSENINYNSLKTEGEMTAAEMKELGFRGNVKKLLDDDNKKALVEELRSIEKSQELKVKYRTIVAQYGSDSIQAKQFIEETRARQTELAETLGYADSTALKEETKAVNEALRELHNLTSVHGKENTKLAKGLLQDAAVDVRQYGSISNETKERIYNEMVSMGRTSNRETIDQNLKDTLKKTVLKISNMDAANIPDFEQFRKSLFGKIGGISKGGKGEYIDVAYNELHELFPERFPEGIVHPAEQLEQIARVAEDLKIKETPLLDAMSKEERASLKESFHTSLTKVEENLQRVVQRQTERKEKQIRKVMASEMKMNVDSLSTKDMEGLFNERYQVEKELERAKKRASLTSWEKNKVEQLLYGETSLDEVAKASVSVDSVKRIGDVYNVEKQLRQIEGTIGDYRAAKDVGRKNFIADAAGEIRIAKEGEKGWKDMNPFQMGRLTQERIIEKVAGKKETAKRIIEKIFEPIHTAERDRQLFIREITDRVKNLNIDTKKKYVIQDADNHAYQLSESGLVHYLGSKRYELLKLERKVNGISQQEAELINRFRQEISSAESAVSKAQLTRIDHGIQVFQDIYKKIHPKINEVIIRNGYDPIGYIDGYFPNMFFDDATDPMGKVLQKLGFDFTGKELPMDIAGRTENFRPGKKFAENLLQRTGNRTDYDALRAMDKYLDDISDVIYHTDNIKNLREYEEHLRYTLSPDGVKAEADAIKKNTALSAEDIREKLDRLYKDNSQNHTLQNYVNNVRRYTDLLAGKKHPLDRVLETDIFGRSVYKAVNTIESRVGANMVAGNISSAITNFIPITQGMSAMSTGSNLKGLKESLRYMVKGGMDDITKKSAFLSTREGRQMLYRTGLQKVTDAAVTPMEVIDRFTTQAVWRSRYYENIKKGLEESRAILEADDYSRRLFAGRSKGAMPTYFHSKALKPLTMFQLEVNNQLDFLLKDLPKEAHGSTIKAFHIYSGVFVGAMIYNDVYEKLTGRRAALDPMGMANKALGDFTGTKIRNSVDIAKDALTGKGFQAIEKGERKKASVAAGKLVENIGGNVPFVGGVLFDGGRIPLSAADPGLGSIGGAVFNAAAGDGSWGKAGDVAVKNLSNPFYYAALPFGGSQLRKTVGGLSTMARGGSYSVTNNGERLQFPVNQSSPAKWAQAGVLGKWALQEGQGYLNGQTKAFSEKQTSTYEKLKEKGIVNMQAYGAIGQVMQAGSQEEKRSALRTAPIREEGRPIIYYDLLASEKDRGVMDTLQRMGEDDFTIYDCVEQLTDSKTDNRKRNVLINSKMSEESKKYVYREKVTKDDDKRIYDFSQAGMNLDEFLMVKNYLYVTKDRSLPTAQKRELFVNWVLEKGYSKGQREVIYESFDIGKKYRR